MCRFIKFHRQSGGPADSFALGHCPAGLFEHDIKMRHRSPDAAGIKLRRATIPVAINQRAGANSIAYQTQSFHISLPILIRP